MDSDYRNTMTGFDFYRLNSVDIILILLVIFMSFGFFLFSSLGLDWRLTSGRLTSGAAISIFHNGKPLTPVDTQNTIFPILGGKMTLEIANEKIRVIESNCPQQICVNAGWIEIPGQIITCVPNKILIEIDSPHGSVVDAVVR